MIKPVVPAGFCLLLVSEIPSEKPERLSSRAISGPNADFTGYTAETSLPFSSQTIML
jgi:hypothetical protein